jgi:hypothetical protein
MTSLTYTAMDADRVYVWCPGDGTRYEFFLSGPLPDGDRLFLWLNGRTRVKALRNPPPIRLGDEQPTSDVLARVMKLGPYDAKKLPDFFREIGYPNVCVWAR